MHLIDVDGRPVFHSMASSFGRVLEAAHRDIPAIVALGPVYEEDPAAELLSPFLRSAERTGWKVTAEEDLAPDWVLEKARLLRAQSSIEIMSRGDLDEISTWTRAGLVLEMGSRWGIKIQGLGTIHPSVKLKGSITGRFGYDGVSLGGKRWNPLTIPKEDRHLVVPTDDDASVAVIDFRAMDVCSMLSLVPGLRDRYGSPEDPHKKTGEILLGREPTADERAAIKDETFSYAYGGETMLRRLFEEKIPELKWLRDRPRGEAGRLIQERSAKTFRAALSGILPHLMLGKCKPMFAVHDELVLSVLRGQEDLADRIADGMEDFASSSSEVLHSVRISWGKNYHEAKSGG